MKIFTVEEKGTVISMVAIGKKLDAIEFIVVWTNCTIFDTEEVVEKICLTEEYKKHFPSLIKQNSGRLPINKYLSEATKKFEECEKVAAALDFEHIISNTIKKNRRCLGQYTSVMQIWNQ